MNYSYYMDLVRLSYCEIHSRYLIDITHVAYKIQDKLSGKTFRKPLFKISNEQEVKIFLNLLMEFPYKFLLATIL